MKSITSLSHPLVKELSALIQSKKERAQKKRVVVEGIKMVSELKKSALLILATDASLFPDVECEKILVSESVLKKISALENPEGILALLPLPQLPIPKNAGRLLALDGVSDPGNVGTLFRTALAFGWQGIYLLEGTADPLSSKVIRAAKGATFHLPFEEISKGELLKLNVTLYTGDLVGAIPTPLSKEERAILVLGSEGRGVSNEIKERAKALSLPMRDSSESLNVAVAGGILLYLLGGAE